MFFQPREKRGAKEQAVTPTSRMARRREGGLMRSIVVNGEELGAKTILPFFAGEAKDRLWQKCHSPV